MSEIYFAEPKSKAWKQAWGFLEDHQAHHSDHLTYGGATVMQDPESGEVWQYMGTIKETEYLWRHEFRHRWHPIMERRCYLKFSTTLNPEQGRA